MHLGAKKQKSIIYSEENTIKVKNYNVKRREPSMKDTLLKHKEISINDVDEENESEQSSQFDPKLHSQNSVFIKKFKDNINSSM